MKGFIFIATIVILVFIAAFHTIHTGKIRAFEFSIVQPQVTTSSPDLLQPVSSSIRYVTYSQEAFDTVYQQKRILFFYAPWCAACNASDEELNTYVDKIPHGVIVFRVNYDTELPLRRSYNVTSQHTFLLLDEKGKVVKEWNQGGLDQILENTSE